MVLSLLPNTIFAANLAKASSENTDIGNNFSILPAGEIFLKVGESLELELANLPVGSTEADVTWEYSDEYLSMSGNTITANAPGVVNITAKITLEDEIIASDSRDVIIYALAGVCGAEGDGSNVSWKIDPDSNTLTISGNGPMQDYISTYSISGTEYNSAPWYPYCRYTRGNNSIGEELTVIVADGVTSIGNYAFSTEFDTINATKVELPDSITRLGKHTGIKYLSSLPENLEVLDDEALYGTTFLNNSVYIPESVRSVGNYALYSTTWPDTPNLDSAFFYGNAPESFGENVFCNSDTFTIYYIVGTGGWTDSDAYDAAVGTWNGYKLEPWNGVSDVATIKGFYPGNNAQIENLEQSMIRIRFDREVLSGQVRNNYADLDFSKTPLAIYRASDDRLIYQVKENNGDGISFAVTSYSSSPTEVNISITNAESLFAPGESYYVSMGAGFIQFADGTVSPEISKNSWSFAIVGVKADEILKKQGEFKFLSEKFGGDNKTITYTYDYDESWFFQSSYKYQHDLTRMSMRVAMAAFGSYNNYGGYETTYSEDNIRDLLTGDNGLGFENAIFNYPEPEYDSIGYAVGSKNIKSESGEACTLILVAVRGAGYGVEWGSNLQIGFGEEHEGFSFAALKVIDGIKQFIQDNQSSMCSNIKVWISGYSRAAAVSNLVARALDDGEIKGINSENVFAFCFECPQNTRATDIENSRYSNIVNIINPIDFVPKVAMSAWGYGRYGTNYYIPSQGSEKNYSILKQKMINVYSDIIDDISIATISTSEKSNQSSILDTFMDNLADEFKSPKNYFYNHETNMMEIAARTLGGQGGYIQNSGAFISEVIELGSLAASHPIITSSTVALFTKQFASQAHYPELCLAWIDSLEGNYVEKQIENIYRKVFVNCPVDIIVYDSNNTVVAEIRGDVVNEVVDGISAYIDDNKQKILILPKNGEYNIEIFAVDNGLLSYQVVEYNAGKREVHRIVNYYDIEIEKGDTLRGHIENIINIPVAYYSLMDADGEPIVPSTDLSENVPYYKLSVQASGNGTVTGGGNYIVGEYARVTASPNKEESFLGWYCDGRRYSEEKELRIRMENNLTIQAKFTNSSNYNTDSTAKKYSVIIKDAVNGNVDCSITCAEKGDLITLAVIPDSGYQLETLSITDSKGKRINTITKNSEEYEFTMPDSEVIVEAIFRPVQDNRPVDVFLDIDSIAWYCNAVKYVVENGIMSGTGTYTFEPNTTLSRGMIAQMLYALEGKPNVSGTGYFNDVPVNAWFAQAAAWAQSKGIITGYDNGNFGPNDPLTREQLALILYNYAKTKGYGTSAAGNLSQFVDGSSTSVWAQEGMAWAVGAGLLSGRDGNMLCPTGTATRAEVAQIMMNFCENVKE